VFFLHDPRETLAKGARWRSSVRRPNAHGKDHGIEFYLRGRYFTVTGQLSRSTIRFGKPASRRCWPYRRGCGIRSG
jgi:hypothetical protein